MTTGTIEFLVTGNIVDVRASGKLTKEFYQEFVPAVDAVIAEHGKVRVVFEMHDFAGWTAGALWEDIKFDMTHWNKIERIAIIGETAWEKGMAAFCKPFTAAKIQYFDHTAAEAARTWVQAD